MGLGLQPCEGHGFHDALVIIVGVVLQFCQDMPCRLVVQDLFNSADELDLLLILSDAVGESIRGDYCLENEHATKQFVTFQVSPFPQDVVQVDPKTAN